MKNRFRHVVGVILLIGGLMVVDRGFLVTSEAAAEMSAACSCSGYAHGHDYSTGYVGSSGTSSYFYIGNTSTALDCSLTCQNWAWGLGSSVCTNYSLRGGVGYVVLDWNWLFGGGGSGNLVQPYDCDDL